MRVECRRLSRTRDRSRAGHRVGPDFVQPTASSARMVPDYAALNAVRAAARCIRAHPRRRHR